MGTSVHGNNVSLVAGNDLTAQVHANEALNLAAGHDVNLTDAHDVHSEEHDRSVKSTSYINTSSKRFGSIDPEWRSRTDSHSSTQSTSVGTLLSGDTVTIGAGHDINATAAQIAGTHDVVLAAGHDLNLKAGENTYTESQGSRSSHTGLMNNGGFSVLIGNRTLENTNTVSETSYTGSLVGSTDGKVTLSAGNNVHITGSDVISQAGTAIVGKNVTIDAAVGATDARQTQKMSQGGINVGIGGALSETLQGAYNSAKRGSEVKDDRLKALYAAQAAYQASDALKMAGGAEGQLASYPKDGSPGNANGINLQVGIGGSSASAKAQTHDEQAYGSHIRSQGDVTIAATGGDLTIVGSQVSGQNVALAAKNNLNLLSQTEQHTDTSTNKNASGGIGLQIGSDGIGIYAQAAVGQGKAHGNGTTHDETVIDAKDTLTLISGNDTNIIGAQAKGNTVLANIGGNLNIASQQDTDDYASKQWQAAGKVVIGYSSGGSASYSQGKIESHYASVNEVSGIGAGSGGYQINVGGNTDLKGAVIASTADPSRNLLSTGSLTFSDIQNKASYSASQVGMSGGYSSGGGGGSGGFSAMPSGSLPQHDNSSSTTRAGIAEGVIDVRNGPTDLSGLDRNPTLANQSLKAIFDEQKVRENQELGQVAGYVGMRAAGTLADYMANSAHTEAEKKAWSDGGIYKTALHGMVGAVTAALGNSDVLQGGLGAASGEAASKIMSDFLWDQYHISADSQEGKSLMSLASAAIGGIVGGGAGAATALQGELYNRQLHPNEIKLITGELAAKYAAEHPGMSERDAETILINQSLRQVDDAWAEKLGPDDNEAKQWLANNTPDWARQNGYFTATPPERADRTINGQYYDKAFHNYTTSESVKADLKAGLLGDDGDPSVHGSLVTRDGYNDVANDLRDQGTMEYLERKAASGQGLTTQEAQTYAHLATLYPLLRLGALGPYGQLGVAIRDQDGAAALAAVAGGIPGEGALANGGKLIGSMDHLTVAEQGFVREILSGGRTVEIIPTAAGRTADFLIDGVRYELKTMSGVVDTSSDGLSGALSSRIMDARGQSGNIIIDARSQEGMTAEVASRGIGRALGQDNKTGSKINQIAVITRDGTVYVPRK